MESLINAAIPLTLDSLNSIKWNDEKENIHNFDLAILTSDRWQAIGKLLKKNMDLDLEKIKDKHEGNCELCWSSIMENWLFKQGSPTYPANWDGLYNLLKDSGVHITILRLLKTAVIRAVHPSPSPPDVETAPAPRKICV